MVVKLLFELRYWGFLEGSFLIPSVVPGSIKKRSCIVLCERIAGVFGHFFHLDM